jgi:tRNA pseudouridine(38-40) synthase
MNLYPSGTYNGCHFAILLSFLLLLVHGIPLTEGFSSFLWSKSSSLSSSSSAPSSSWNNNPLEPHRPHCPERRHRTVGRTTTVSPRPRNNRRLGHSTLAFTTTTAALPLQEEEEEEAGWTGTVEQQDTRPKIMEYVESYEEQRLRLWWELDPFSIASDIVNSVLLLAPTTTNNNNDNNSNHQGCTIPLLHRLDGTSFFKQASSSTATNKRTASMATRYEDLFHVLYSGRLNINNTLDNHDGENNPVEEVTIKPNEKVQQHFALTMAYRGDDFCGWQRQPNNSIQPSVQAIVEDSLQAMLIQFQVEQQQQRQPQQPPSLPRVDVRVCGRTDAGVHALAQVCRFRTTSNVSMDQIQTNLSLKFLSLPSKATSVEAATVTVEGSPLPSLGLKCTHIRRVSKNFHPTFGATCRAYTYLMDIDWNEEDSITTTTTGKSATTSTSTTTKSTSSSPSSSSSSTSITLTTRQIQRLNQMLEYLQDQELDYFAMSYGKLKTQTSNCTLYHAKACLVQYCATTITTTTTTERPRTALCIELVGNRFLRRMVRILVSTALQLAVQDDDNQSNNNPSNEDPASLYHVLQRCDRSVTAKPAPPKGLIFVGARFENDIS